jgi:hypothetical protein
MTFNLLWFEDNIANFDKIIPNIEKHLAEFHSKELKHDVYDHYHPDFDVKLFEGKYSLAIIDLNLSNGQKGIEVIEILRTNGTYMDVLLFSNNPIELMKLTEGENYVEGVFRHATMNGMEQKIKDVIDQVLYKEMMVLERNK